MIDIDSVLSQALAYINDRYGEDSPESKRIRKAFRVYIAWLGAPEEEIDFGRTNATASIEPLDVSLVGKRVRLVEVKDE